MSRLSNLLRQVETQDPQLAADLKQEIEAVSGRRAFGLNFGCFCHQLLLPRPYLVLTKPLRLDIQCQRGASVKIGWKYLDD